MTDPPTPEQLKLTDGMYSLCDRPPQLTRSRSDLMQYLRKMNQFETEKEARLRCVSDELAIFVLLRLLALVGKRS
jgi:hypothetical protein